MNCFIIHSLGLNMIRNIYQGPWSPFNCFITCFLDLILIRNIFLCMWPPFNGFISHFLHFILVRNILYQLKFFFNCSGAHLLGFEAVTDKKNKTDLIRIISLHIFWVTYQPETNYNNMGSFTYLFALVLLRNMIKPLSTWFEIFVIHFLVTVLRDIYKQCCNYARQVSQNFSICMDTLQPLNSNTSLTLKKLLEQLHCHMKVFSK